MNTVTICSAANETYVLGLAVALISTISHAPKDADLRVYVLDGGIRDRSWKKLQASVAMARPGCELVRLFPDLSGFLGLPQDWGSSVMTYARLALPEMVAEDRLLYVDADLIVQADWEMLWQGGCDDAVVAAAPDVITGTLKQDRLDLEKFDLDADAPYFQAGLLLMDLRRWREFEVSKKALAYLRENPEHCRYWDQSALNVVLYRRWKALAPSWNTPAWWADQGREGKTLKDTALHFVGPHKPWIYNYHRSASADIFFQILDRTSWRGWRPSGVRQSLKWVKYRALKAADDLRAIARRTAKA